ncbi:hypothetical protein [Thalassoroseus pseudoceratinae]|uniref:hypothetical protein n=1 Tax=Thalassoroseus pseudoceratinae TaxID=2713176 RepID=UPI0014231FF2|nr:hypothetical protein [Thalassoroseus pseudoceratinae]
MGYLVLGTNADMGITGGVPVGYEHAGINLANGDDEIVLLDDGLNEIDRVEYDGGPNIPDPNGASMELIDASQDNNVGSNWATATTTFGDDDIGIPGARNSVSGADTTDPTMQTTDPAGELIANGTTDEQGQFTLQFQGQSGAYAWENKGTASEAPIMGESRGQSLES